MATSTRSNAHHPGATMRNLNWSATEKAVARKAFDLALQRDLEAVMAETKTKAGKVRQPSDLWELERYLTERRKHIDRQYDFRYSVFPLVFADLIRQGRLRAEELRGLAEDKLEYIRWHSRL
jgi:hypothetical protein